LSCEFLRQGESQHIGSERNKTQIGVTRLKSPCLLCFQRNHAGQAIIEVGVESTEDSQWQAILRILGVIADRFQRQ